MSDGPATQAVQDKASEGVSLRPWASLQYPDYALLLGSSLFSGVALQMRQIANLWQVYELSGSAIQLGLTGLFQALPLFALGLFGGALADIMNRKSLILITHAINFILALVLTVLTMSGQIQVWHIFLVTSLTSAINIVGGPARMAMVPRLVPQSHLMNAIAFNTTSGQSAFFLGPMAAGLAIDALGIGQTYLLNTLVLVPPIFAILAIRASGSVEGGRRVASLQGIWEGMHFVWRERVIFGLLLLDFGVTVVGYFRTLLPIFAKDILKQGAGGLGLLSSAPAVGSVLGALVLLLSGNLRNKGRLVLVSAAFYGVALIIFGTSSLFWLSLLLVGVLGFTDAISVTVRQTTVQLLTPDQLRGRAFSIFSIFALGANSVGAMEAGIVAALIGAPGAMMLGGAIGIAVVLGIAVGIRQVRQYDA